MSLPPSSTTAVCFNKKDLENFPLTEFELPQDCLEQIEVGPQFAVVLLDLTHSPEQAPEYLYPNLRRLARRLSSDCLQLGLAVPIVIQVRPPTGQENAWRQADFDTELNAGEFQMLIIVAGDDPNLLGSSFAPPGLLNPIQPSGPATYREALRHAAVAEGDTPRGELLRLVAEAGWHNPKQVSSLVLDLAESYLPDDTTLAKANFNSPQT